jgi:hypothetical protein
VTKNAFAGWAAAAAAASMLSACAAQTNRRVSWSSSGDAVAFPNDEQRIVVYSIKRNDVRPLPAKKEFQTVVWSPTEDRLAAYYKGKVYLFTVDDKKIALSDDYRIAWGKEKHDRALLNWHASGRRLLVAPESGDPDETFEINIDSRALVSLGKGAAIYGPGAGWLLWSDKIVIGRGGKIVVDRQSYVDLWTRYPRRKDLKAAARAADAESYPMDDEMRDSLESAGGVAYADFSGYGGAVFCVPKADAQAGRTSVYCLEPDGSLTEMFSIALSTDAANPGGDSPPQGPKLAVDPDPTGTYFAASETIPGRERRLRVFDRAGAALADGKKFLDRIAGDMRGARSLRNDVCPSVLWSQDRRWLSCFFGGSLYLWDWRADDVRVVDLAALQKPKR